MLEIIYPDPRVRLAVEQEDGRDKLPAISSHARKPVNYAAPTSINNHQQLEDDGRPDVRCRFACSRSPAPRMPTISRVCSCGSEPLCREHSRLGGEARLANYFHVTIPRCAVPSVPNNTRPIPTPPPRRAWRPAL